MVVMQLMGHAVGGVRRHVVDIILETSGDMVETLLIYSTEQEDTEFKNIKGFLKQKCIAAEGLKISKSPKVSDIFQLIRILYFMIKYKVDVVHCHGAKAGILGRIAGSLLARKTVYTPHGGSLHFESSDLKGAFYLGMERMMAALTSLFVFESCYSRNAFFSKVKKLPDRSFIINTNGVAPAQLFHPRPVEERKLVFIGALRSEKGVMILPDIMGLLSTKGYTLDIYGSGELKEELEAKFAVLGLSDLIVFRGDASGIQEKLRDYDGVIMPSTHESLGYVALEAVAVGCPVFNSGVGGLNEIFNGFTSTVCSSGDARRYAEMIESFYLEPRYEREELAIRGQSLIARDFNLSKMVRRLNEAYLGLVKEKNV